MDKAPAIGIDSGTWNCYAAVYQNGQVKIIPNEFGREKTPSFVSFTETETLIGKAAKNQIEKNPKNTIFGVTRLIGRKFWEIERNKLFPFNAKIEEDKVKFKATNGNEYFPEDIFSILLRNLKKNTSEFLGKEVKEAVIAVPNYFGLLQKKQLEITACKAGLNIIKVIDSSTAAGLACIYDSRQITSTYTIIAIDLGGGILNVGLYVSEDGLLECISKNGNINLGGQDFDNRIIEYCEGEFRRKTGINIKSNIKAKGKLINTCEKTKKMLSSSTQTSILVKICVKEKI